MKLSAILLFVVLAKSLTVVGQVIPIPDQYNIIYHVSGDLDNDGIKELVVAYNTKESKFDTIEYFFENVPRELIIYKKHHEGWIVWKKSAEALRGSKEGGMFDPFETMSIEKGILQIIHAGGAGWKWTDTDKYRYQDGTFYLIGYSEWGGMPCENWMNVDFNLSTGKLVVNKEYEKCENREPQIYKREYETVIKKGIKITIENRNDKEIKIVTPKYGHEIYISIGKE